MGTGKLVFSVPPFHGYLVTHCKHIEPQSCQSREGRAAELLFVVRDRVPAATADVSPVSGPIHDTVTDGAMIWIIGGRHVSTRALR